MDLEDQVLAKITGQKKPKKPSKIHFRADAHEKANYDAIAHEYPSYVNKTLKTVKWSKLSRAKAQRLSLAFLKKHKQYLDWKILSSIRTFSESELLELKDVIDWKKISQRQNFADKELLIFQNYIDWKIYSRKNTTISAELFYELVDRMDRPLRPCKLNVKIAQKYDDQLDWNWVIINADFIDPEVFKQFEHRFGDFYWASYYHNNIPVDLIMKHKKTIDLENFVKKWPCYRKPLSIMECYWESQYKKITPSMLVDYYNDMTLSDLQKYHQAELIIWSKYLTNGCYKELPPEVLAEFLTVFPFLATQDSLNKHNITLFEKTRHFWDSPVVSNIIEFYFKLPEEQLINFLDSVTDCDNIEQIIYEYQNEIPLSFWKNHRDSILNGEWVSKNNNADDSNDSSSKSNSSSSNAGNSEAGGKLNFSPGSDGTKKSVPSEDNSGKGNSSSSSTKQSKMNQNHPNNDMWVDFLNYLPVHWLEEVLWEVRDRVVWQEYKDELFDKNHYLYLKLKRHKHV